MTKDSHRQEFTVISLVASHFPKKKHKDDIAIHINGLQDDNFVGNIKYVSRKECGLLTGTQNGISKKVCKIDNTGEIVEFYKSARDCARHNYMSYQTVLDRCNYVVKSLYAPDGYIYCYDTEKDYRNVLNRLKEECCI